MAGKRKLEPLEVFEITIADAHHLVNLVEGFENQRKYRMRRELREKLGEALHLSERSRDNLDCLESRDLFLVFKPGSTLQRSDFTDARPLLRQVEHCVHHSTPGCGVQPAPVSRRPG
jgi:hypothetical protein